MFLRSGFLGGGGAWQVSPGAVFSINLSQDDTGNRGSVAGLKITALFLSNQPINSASEGKMTFIQRTFIFSGRCLEKSKILTSNYFFHLSSRPGCTRE